MRQLELTPVPRRMLVVEDNIPIARMLIEAIEEAGHRVAGHARSVEHSLQLVAECMCDAAVLDIDLLGANSSPVAQALNIKNIPFVVVTGSVEMITPAHSKAPVILKPFKLTDVIDTLIGLGCRSRPAISN